MDFILDILTSPLFWGVLVTLLAIAKEKRNALLSEVSTFSREVVKSGAGSTLVKQSGILYLYVKEYRLIADEKLTTALQLIVGGIAKIAKSIDDSISLHTQNIMDSIGEKDERSWKILGYLVQLILLTAFFIADIIQTLNSLTIYYPEEIAKISFVLDYLPLPIAIVMASVGTALALGLIVSDFASVTKFGDWNKLQGGYRIFIQALTYITLLVAVSIAVVINLSKVVSIPDISATLSVNFVEGVKFWAGIAQNVVIFPLYSTTFLFFSGLKGLKVLYLFIVFFINFIIKILHGLVWMITVLAMKGGTTGVKIAIKGALLIVATILVLLGSIFIGGGVVFAFLFTLVQKILEFVFYPTDIVFDKLWAYIDKRNNNAISEL